MSVPVCDPFVVEKLSKYGLDSLTECFMDPTNEEILEEIPLKKLLRSSPKGKYILGYFEMKRKLDDDSRNKLSEIILENELGPNTEKRLNREDFSKLAAQIPIVFPSESKDIYFRVVLKRCSNGKLKKDDQGKLFCKYYNIRKSLRRVGLLNSEQGDDDIVPREDDEGASEESLCWLKNNIEPWGQVEMYWRKTFIARQNELKQTPIYTYYATYRVLRENRGFTLLENGFNSMYPEHDMNMYANWSEFSQKVIERGKNMNY